MTDILSIAAVAGPFVGAVAAYAWQERKVRDLRRLTKLWDEQREKAVEDGWKKDARINELIEERDSLKGQLELSVRHSETDHDEIAALRAERDGFRGDLRAKAKEVQQLREKLALAGKPDKQAISEHMRAIGLKGNQSDKRKNRKAANDGQDAAA